MPATSQAHVRSCAACRELLHALETEGVWLREALAADEESIPARVIAAPEKNSAHWGWWTALGLVGFGAYSIWTGFVQPWLTQASNDGFTQGNVLTVLFFTGTFWKGWDTMRTLMEVMAMGTLAFVGIWLLRRQWQRFTAIAFVMGALALALAHPAACGGATRAGADTRRPYRQSRLYARRRAGGEGRSPRAGRSHPDRWGRRRRPDRW